MSETKSSRLLKIQEKEIDTYGPSVFSGPNGTRDHHVKVKDQMYIGTGTISEMARSEAHYLISGCQTVPYPEKRQRQVGEIGWWYHDPEFQKQMQEIRSSVAINPYRLDQY